MYAYRRGDFVVVGVKDRESPLLFFNVLTKVNRGEHCKFMVYYGMQSVSSSIRSSSSSYLQVITTNPQTKYRILFDKGFPTALPKEIK